MSSSELSRLLVRGRAVAAPRVQRARRAAFLARLRALALAAGAELDLQVHPDVVVGRDLRLEVGEGTTNRLVIGPGCRLGDGTRLQLKGGDVELEGWVDLRPGCTLNISGTLRIGTAVSIGTGTMFHVAHEVVVGRRCAFAEYVTVVDTTHVATQPDAAMALGTAPGSVRIGEGCFIAAKVTLPRNSRVGDHCVVGACSVVVGEVPPRSFVSGVPARHVKEVSLPWE